MPRTIETVLEELQAAGTFDDLRRFVIELRESLDIEHVVYHSVNAAGGQYAALTYSPEWVAHYIEQEYDRVDPVVSGCFQRFHPVDWKRLDWTGKAQRSFLGEAIGAGVGRQGYSVPIRGPKGQFALFTVSDNRRDDAWSSFVERQTRELILIAHYLNEAALRIEGGPARQPQQSLSPRETDALTLLAMGLSRAQAAESLSISEHTLRVYIESARFKLGALNTTHAVARAMSLGLLII